MSKYRVVEVTDYDGTFYQCEKKGLSGWKVITILVGLECEMTVSYKTLEEAKAYVDKLAYKRQRNVVYECGDD